MEGRWKKGWMVRDLKKNMDTRERESSPMKAGERPRLGREMGTHILL
jgi:hypothetical protein